MSFHLAYLKMNTDFFLSGKPLHRLGGAGHG